MRGFVLDLRTKFAVRRPYHLEDMRYFVCEIKSICDLSVVRRYCIIIFLLSRKIPVKSSSTYNGVRIKVHKFSPRDNISICNNAYST